MRSKIVVSLIGIAGQIMMHGEAYASESSSLPTTRNTTAGRINPETGAWQTTSAPAPSKMTPAGRMNPETGAWEATSTSAANNKYVTRHDAGARDMAPEAPSSQITKCQKPFQFYMGLSGGLDRMTGHRSESVFNPHPSTSTFSDNHSFSNNNAQYSVFGGVSFDMSSLPLFFAPEFYVGRGHTTDELRGSVIDSGTNTQRTLQASIEHRYFWGAIIQAGVNLTKEFRTYVLLGLDRSQYRYTPFYTPRSSTGLGLAGPDLLPTYSPTMKWMSSVVWGVGIEKTIYNKFRLGADIRILRSFKTFKFTSQIPSGDNVTNDTINSFFKPKNLRLSLRFSYLF